MADKSEILLQIEGMRGFLKACELTAYMLPEQINLISMSLDALEREIKNEQNGGE